MEKENYKIRYKRYTNKEFEKLTVFDAVRFMDQIKEYQEDKKCIFSYERLNLKNSGDNKGDRVQIFTPDFIVKDMVKLIPKNEVLNYATTILEPSSGDGAFTTYILKMRLDKASKYKNTFILNMFRALSTIYSVELDRSLVFKQRNNMYTLVHQYLDKTGLELTTSQDELLKYILINNIMWAMTNIVTPFDGDNVIYKAKQKGNLYEALKFPVWTFDRDLNVSLKFEGVDTE